MSRAKIEVGPWDEIRDRVFRLRCQSKEGRALSETDQRFLDAAFRKHGIEYAAIGREVFEATKPFGSSLTERACFRCGHEHAATDGRCPACHDSPDAKTGAQQR